MATHRSHLPGTLNTAQGETAAKTFCGYGRGMRCTRRRFLSLTLAAAAHAQTLAHPGWRGNGIAAEAWWRRTAIVRLPPATTFAQAFAAMDAMSAAGVDTMLLPDLQPQSGGALPFAEQFGSEDDLDALLREASARRIHVLLMAPLLRLAGNSSEVRFWMTRGVAGFDVGAVKPFEVDTLLLLRTAVDRFPGQRLLLIRMDAPLLAIHGGPVLRVVSQREAISGSMAIDVGTGPVPAGVPTGAVPMVDLSAISTEAGQDQIRKLSTARNKKGLQGRNPS